LSQEHDPEVRLKHESRFGCISGSRDLITKIICEITDLMGDPKMVGVAAKEFDFCQEIRLALPASPSSPNTLSLAEIPVQ